MTICKYCKMDAANEVKPEDLPMAGKVDRIPDMIFYSCGHCGRGYLAPRADEPHVEEELTNVIMVGDQKIRVCSSGRCDL